VVLIKNVLELVLGSLTLGDIEQVVAVFGGHDGELARGSNGGVGAGDGRGWSPLIVALDDDADLIAGVHIVEVRLAAAVGGGQGGQALGVARVDEFLVWRQD
jgi:hypothetical protein